MSEWQEVMQNRSDDGYCRERHVLTVDRGPDGRPTVWVSVMRRPDSFGGYLTYWEMALVTPRTGPKRWSGDDVDILMASGADRRTECVGKTVEELLELFRSWGAA